MHGAALDWTVLCTLQDAADLPSGECWGCGPIREFPVWNLTKQQHSGKVYHRVLDVGSQDINGNMRQYDFLGNPPGWLERAGVRSYLGLDMEAGRNVDMVADSHCMPLIGELFDLVLCLNMLEHDTDGAATLAEIYRVLKPGGELVLVCTNEYGAAHEHLGGGNKETFYHWTATALRYAMQTAGFQWPTIFTHGGDNLAFARKAG